MSLIEIFPEKVDMTIAEGKKYYTRLQGRKDK